MNSINYIIIIWCLAICASLLSPAISMPSWLLWIVVVPCAVIGIVSGVVLACFKWDDCSWRLEQRVARAVAAKRKNLGY